MSDKRRGKPDLSPRTKSVGAALARRRRAAADAQSPPAPPPPGPSRGGWDGLQNVAAGLGTTRDKRSFSAYAPVTTLTLNQLDTMYRSSWLAGRIVDTVAGDMTRQWVSLSWDGYDEDDGGADAVQDAEGEFELPGKTQEDITWARLYGGSAMLIGIKGEDPMKPLNLNTIRKGSLQYLHVLDRNDIFTTGELDRTLGPHLSQPLTYMIGDNANGAPMVHWSRVVIFRGRKLPKRAWQLNGCWDDSELQHVMDSVQDYDATRAGIASMIWESNVDILKLGGLAKTLAGPDGEAIVQRRLVTAATLKSFNRMFVIDKEHDDYGQKVIQFSGVKDIVDRFMIDVCGAADIPMTRLFGQSAAGLTSTGEHDLKNYYDHVRAKQASHMIPPLLRIYNVLVRSTLGRWPQKFKVTPNPLWQVSDKEMSEIEKLRAERDKIYWDMGSVNEGAIARELKQEGTYQTLTEEDVDLAEELALQPDPVVPATTKKDPVPAEEEPPVDDADDPEKAA